MSMSSIRLPTLNANFTKTVSTLQRLRSRNKSRAHLPHRSYLQSHSTVYPAISPLGALAGSAKHFTGSVLITGSGRGIGRLAALNFARAGVAKVVITSRSGDELDEVEKLIKSDPQFQDVKVVKFVGDILKEDDVERLFDAAGDVEVLINNAGALEKPTKIAESKADQWFRTWEGTYLPTRELLRRLERSPRSSPVTIINTSSVGSINTSIGYSSYQSSKSAINRFTEFLHYEYPGTIRTFAYHPGGVKTKLSAVRGEVAEPTLRDDPELAGCYALWLATQPEKADFLRGRYSSCKWVGWVFTPNNELLCLRASFQDVDELVARKAEVEENGLLFTVVAGLMPIRS
ncbi:hypothetical protein P7C70_g77, partial [Phenoliferia sp. Uapishka_3]